MSFAISCHKSQGATIENAQIDICNKIFAPGQAYVAFSRVKSLDGLYLSNFDPSNIIVNKKVLDFYKSNNLHMHQKTKLQMLWCILTTFHKPSSEFLWVGLFANLSFQIKQKILTLAYSEDWI